jgi:hypothetical protein
MKAIVQDLIDLAGKARHPKAERLAQKDKAPAGNSRPEHAYYRPELTCESSSLRDQGASDPG